MPPTSNIAFAPSVLLLHTKRPRPLLCRPTRRTPTASVSPSPSPPRSTSSASPSIAHGTRSLQEGTWFKLICGASTHDAPAVRNLSHVYTMAGADCIDVAADPAVIGAAREGIERAAARGAERPLLMASVNDASDIHFRKAHFDPTLCPSDCPRPCENACPANAINKQGVIEARCYGCARCLPVCPLGLVETREFVLGADHIRDVIYMVDALEIHTGVDRLDQFEVLWQLIEDAVAGLQVVAVSLPDLGDDHTLSHALNTMWQVMKRVLTDWRIELIWQTDGRPMSGDIGAGTAHDAVRLADRVRRLLTQHGIGGHVQLAGGTNQKTVPLMAEAGLLRRKTPDPSRTAAGVAMGGYARKIVNESLGEQAMYKDLANGELLDKAVTDARQVVNIIKRDHE